MQKVGLVSVRNYNYGSILQAYAFQQLLFKNGIDNEIIYYEKKLSFKQMMRIFNGPLLKSKCKSIYRKLGSKNDKKTKYILEERNKAFKEFVDAKFVFSRPYIGRRNLNNAYKDYRCFILGSDQVWNPMNLGSDFYTLSFVPNKMFTATYASSFGVAEIPRWQRRQTKKYLSRIDEIAVREYSGQKIVKELIDKEVEVVVDPTMLLNAEDWNQLLSDDMIIERPYIFAYFVGANKEHRESVKELANTVGCDIILIPHVDELVDADKQFCDERYAKIGPKEFVNLIKNAQYVCTDSFHATIFSIQYKKKFIVFDRYNSDNKASMNTRLSSILSRLGLEHRMVSHRKNIFEWYDEEIEYDTVMEELDDFRYNSEKYLDRIVNMVKEV